jgi:hypothetical protein
MVGGLKRRGRRTGAGVAVKKRRAKVGRVVKVTASNRGSGDGGDSSARGLGSRLSNFAAASSGFFQSPGRLSVSSDSTGSGSFHGSGSLSGDSKSLAKNERMLTVCYPPAVLLKGVDVVASAVAVAFWEEVKLTTPFIANESSLFSLAQTIFKQVMTSLGRGPDQLSFDEFWNTPLAKPGVRPYKGGKVYVYRKVRDTRISQLQRLVGFTFCNSCET